MTESAKHPTLLFSSGVDLSAAFLAQEALALGDHGLGNHRKDRSRDRNPKPSTLSLNYDLVFGLSGV